MSIKMMMEMRQIRIDMQHLEERINKALKLMDEKVQANSSTQFEHDSSAIELAMMKIKELESKVLTLQEQQNAEPQGRKKRVI